MKNRNVFKNNNNPLFMEENHSLDSIESEPILEKLLVELATKKLNLMPIHDLILRISWYPNTERAKEIYDSLDNQRKITLDRIKSLKNSCDHLIKDSRNMKMKVKIFIIEKLCEKLQNENFYEWNRKKEEQLNLIEHGFRATLPPLDNLLNNQEEVQKECLSLDLEEFFQKHEIDISKILFEFLLKKMTKITLEQHIENSVQKRKSISTELIKTLVKFVSQKKVEEYHDDIRKIQTLKINFEREKNRRNLGTIFFENLFQLTPEINLLEFPWRNLTIFLFFSIVLIIQLIQNFLKLRTFRIFYTFLQYETEGTFLVIVK